MRPAEVAVDVDVLGPSEQDPVKLYVFAVEAKPAHGAQAAYGSWSPRLYSPVLRIESEERELLVRVAGKYSGVGMVWEGAAVGKLSSGLREGQTLRLNASAVPWVAEQLRGKGADSPETPETPDMPDMIPPDMWITSSRPMTGLVPVPPRRPHGDDRRPSR